MRVREAAEYLTRRGYTCSAGTVRGLARAGKLHSYRPGVSGRGRYEFTIGQLDAFLLAAETGGSPPASRKVGRPALRKPPEPVTVPRPADWRGQLKDEVGR